MRAVILSDLHLEAGAALGWPDRDYGNSRLRDAEDVLRQVVAEPHDVLVFAGDVGRTSRLTPTAYRILQRTLRSSDAPKVLVTGNHDYAGASEDTSLHVLADSVDGICFDRPEVGMVGDLQIGALPWAPPARLFGQAKHNPRKLHRLVADRLLDVARGLGQQIDPAKPSLLVVHWLVSSSALASGSSVVEAQEPILHVDELEGSGPWDVIACGHNHKRQQAGARTYVIGSPMRDSFGEQDLQTGFLVMEDREARWVDTVDRPMQTIDVDLSSVDPDDEPIDVQKGAIVRLRVSGTEEQVKRYPTRRVIQQLYEDGAGKVIGPQVSVERVDRQRSDLTTDVSPPEALARWAAMQELDEAVKARVLRLGAKIIGA